MFLFSVRFTYESSFPLVHMIYSVRGLARKVVRNDKKER